MMSMNLSDITVLNTKGADYHAKNLMQNFDLSRKSRTLQNIKIYYHI